MGRVEGLPDEGTQKAHEGVDAVTMDVKAMLEPESLAEVPLEQIETEITDLAARLAAAECRWLVLIGEFDRREGFGHWGCRSTAHYLNWRCGVSMRAAYERVRVGRALLDLPAIREAFSKGELSYSKVRAITKMACRDNEEELVALARHATAAQIERIAGGVAFVLRRDEAAARAHVERYLRFSTDTDGSLLIWAKIPAEHGAVVMQALEAIVEQIDLQTFVDGHDAEAGECSAEHSDDGSGSAEPPEVSDPWAARYADGLVRMAETVLAQGPAARSDRFLVSIHADLQALFGDDDGAIELPNGTSIAPSVVERLLCDCDTVPVLEIGGRPVYAGNKSPTVSRRLRRKVMARDRRCRFPGCDETRYVDIHHVVWRSRGGPTEFWNLIVLCRFHHRLIHQRNFVVEHANGTFSFRRPDGRAIPEAPGLSAEGIGVVEQHRLQGVDPEPGSIHSRWDGSPLRLFGLNMAVEQFVKQLRECSAEHTAGCPHGGAAEPVAA